MCETRVLEIPVNSFELLPVTIFQTEPKMKLDSIIKKSREPQIIISIFVSTLFDSKKLAQNVRISLIFGHVIQNLHY